MPLSTDEIRRWDEALRQATGSAQQLASALEGIKQSAGSVTEGLSSVTAANQELASGLKTVQDSASQTGAEISTIGSHHSELTNLFVENGKKQQESLETIAKNTAKTTKTMGEEVLATGGVIAKEFKGLADATGLFGDESAILSAVETYAAASTSVASLAEQFKKLEKANTANASVVALGGAVGQTGVKAGGAATAAGRFAGLLGRGAALLGGPWGIGIAAGITLLGAFSKNKKESTEATEKFTEALVAEGGKLQGTALTTLIDNLQEADLSKHLNDAGVSMQDFSSAVTGNQAASGRLNREYEETVALLDEAETASDSMVSQVGEHRAVTDEERDALRNKERALSEVLDILEENTDATSEATATVRERRDMEEALTEATNGAGSATGNLTGQQNSANDAMAEGIRQARDLKTAMDDMTGSNISAAQAEMSFHEAVEKASAAAEKNSETISVKTEEGRENRRALIDLAEATHNQTSAMDENGDSAEEMTAQYELGRAEFLRVAGEMGVTGKAANDLANEYMGIPAVVKNKIEVTATGSWDYTMGGTWHGGGAMNGHGGGGLATGGPVHGPGTATSDSIPAWLSDGEYVQRASSVDYYGPGFMSALNERRIPKHALPGFAKGGHVRWSSTGNHQDPWGRIDETREDVRIGLQRMHNTAANDIGSTFGEMFRRLVASGGPVVTAARSQLGLPYSWGGGGINGPSFGFGRGAGIRGFDCSSLMQYAWYQGAGVRIPRVTYDQINTGRAISRGSEMPGDLVFPHRGHVAMVTKPGQVIHAPYTGASVSHRGMYANPIAIRRPQRFDTGGIWGSGTAGVNESGHPERVLSPRQTRAFEHLVDGVLSSHRVPVSPGSHTTADRPLVGTVNVNHVPGYSTPRDVVRALDHARRTARLARPR